VAPEGRGNVAQKFQPCVEIGPEIDWRSNGFAIRKQGFPVKVRKCVVDGMEAVCPDQSTIFLDAPAIAYVAADDHLAVCGAA
jgi:hypothetical protein